MEEAAKLAYEMDENVVSDYEQWVKKTAEKENHVVKQVKNSSNVSQGKTEFVSSLKLQSWYCSLTPLVQLLLCLILHPIV